MNENRYAEQRFNAKAASVTSLLLLVSILGAFTPTLFQQVWAREKNNIWKNQFFKKKHKFLKGLW